MSRGPALLVTCHPGAHNLCGAIAQLIIETYQARGGALLVHDLATRRFEPVVSQAELMSYFEPALPADIAAMAADLRQAGELIFVFPVWMYAMPAQLKGWFDRLWRPHVAFDLVDGEIVPLLTKVTRLTAIATHGRGKAETDHIGDGTRDYFARSIPSVLPGLRAVARFDFYALDTADSDAIARELAAIRQHFRAEF